ncbi:butyrophilin-like protein 8 [Petaurus breviceps papuanus]|uniref:butyrophilin-like protein 8 n=1 Tax=Petaurus breviceps papuanus TaxID=3040969 RepID=UPI0036DC3A98
MNSFTDMLSISALLCHIQASRSFEYHLFLIFALCLIYPGSGQFQVIGPDQSIQALVGEDALFFCHVSPKMNLKNMELSFFRNQFSSVLLLIKDGKEKPRKQMQEYQGRIQFVQVDIAEGIVSLKLKNVTLSDSGIYGCQFTSQTFNQKYTWELQVVALGSSPLISLERYRDRDILLICRSAGWSPRPEAQWKNHQEQPLSSDFKVNPGKNGLFDIEISLIIQKPPAGYISCSIHIWGFRQESRVRVDGKLMEELDWRLKIEERGWGYASKHAVEVTLDPRTAYPILRVSEDCKKVTCEEIKALDLPETMERFQSPGVVASQGFSLEEFYWEVDVGEKNRWYVGVCWDKVDRKNKDPELSPANGYWVLGRWNRTEHFIFSPSRQALTLQVQPKRVGIFLSCKYEHVSFYNVTDKSHTYTFTGCDFNGKIIRPYFRPRSNDINEHVLPLVICTKFCEQ